MNTVTKIKTNTFADYELAPGHKIGLCGYNHENGGYVYVSEGHSTSEDYLISIDYLIDMLEEDGMITFDLIEVTLNEQKQIVGMHLDVWPS